MAIVLTDGVQTVEKGDTRKSKDILEEAVKPLKDKGVEMFSIGIGRVRTLGVEDLVTIASKTENVHVAEKFNDEINNILKGAVLGKCPGNNLEDFVT